MLVIQRSWLMAGVLIVVANMSSAQTADTLEKYWKSPITTKGRLILGGHQIKNTEPLSRENSFQLDDETAPDANGDGGMLGQLGQTPFSWPRKSIREIKIDPRGSLERRPADRSYLLTEKFSRGWYDWETICKNYYWQSPGISYQPLYFEDVALERYGQSRRGLRQTLVSYGHFFTSAALLPLHMRKDPPYSCDYPLGYCRPGNCAPITEPKHFWN